MENCYELSPGNVLTACINQNIEPYKWSFTSKRNFNILFTRDEYKISNISEIIASVRKKIHDLTEDKRLCDERFKNITSSIEREKKQQTILVNMYDFTKDVIYLLSLLVFMCFYKIYQKFVL